MKGEFQKVDGETLKAIGPEALQALAAVKTGGYCMADVRGARNIKQFRLFWALMGLVADQTNSDKKAVEKWLLRTLNFVDLFHLPDGKVEIAAQSIAYEKMEQAQFASLFRLAIPVIAQLLEAAPKDVIRRFNDMLDDHGRRQFKKLMGREYA